MKARRYAENDDWENKETASASRLEKANKIQKTNSENFSHLLQESDSSDEELKDEEIMKNAVKKYKDQFAGLFHNVFHFRLFILSNSVKVPVLTKAFNKKKKRHTFPVAPTPSVGKQRMGEKSLPKFCCNIDQRFWCQKQPL